MDKKKKLLSEFEHDNLWMSTRYCVGSHTIACYAHASDIVKHCYGRLSHDDSEFYAYDVNREIETHMRCIHPTFIFPSYPQNRIYATAIDIFCEFVTEYNIKTKQALIKYKTVNVIQTDNERGYKFETLTWDEYIQANNLKLEDVLPSMPNPEYYSLSNINDLMVWNDVAHIFDVDKHYKVELTDGSVIECFDTYPLHSSTGTRIFL